MRDMIKRVAEFMFTWPLWGESSEQQREEFRKHARYALRALREPSEDMLKAGEEVQRYSQPQYDFHTKEIWQAMIDAALSSEPPR